ncbi:hypothetical protein BDQ17DRAFT_1435150 [Cyathus striatus]|nr:hypothetical protein BDQ17DRAFT_1435150 [Cyathus striatus]
MAPAPTTSSHRVSTSCCQQTRQCYVQPTERSSSHTSRAYGENHPTLAGLTTSSLSNASPNFAISFFPCQGSSPPCWATSSQTTTPSTTTSTTSGNHPPPCAAAATNTLKLWNTSCPNARPMQNHGTNLPVPVPFHATNSPLVNSLPCPNT